METAENQTYFHASPFEHPDGLELVPGKSLNIFRFPERNNHRVFFSASLEEANVWADLISMTTKSDPVYIYEIKPRGRVYSKMEWDVEVLEFHASSAVVVRRVNS